MSHLQHARWLHITVDGGQQLLDEAYDSWARILAGERLPSVGAPLRALNRPFPEPARAGDLAQGRRGLDGREGQVYELLFPHGARAHFSGNYRRRGDDTPRRPRAEIDAAG